MTKMLKIFLLLILTINSYAYFYKSLAGPPEEFRYYNIPKPINNPTTSNSVLDSLVLKYNKKDNIYYNESILYIDTKDVNFTLISNYVKDLKIFVFDSNRTKIIFNTVFTKYIVGVNTSIPAIYCTFYNNILDNYKLIITYQGIINNTKIGIIYNGDSKIVIKSWLNTYIISKKNTIIINANIDNLNIKNTQLSSTFMPVISGIMEIVLPNGKEYEEIMNDDGIYPDLIKCDGIWTAQLKVDLPGEYSLSPSLLCYLNNTALFNNQKFKRDSRHVISVSNSTTILNGTASMKLNDSEEYIISIYINYNNFSVNTYSLYTEVWGYKNNKLVPIVWLGGLSDVINDTILNLKLDIKWLKRINLCDDIILLNTRLSDPVTSYTVSTYDDYIYINLCNHCKYILCKTLDNLEKIKEITLEMREGINPYKDVLVGNSGVVLLPGYCASSNPWSSYSSIFTKGYFFNEFKLDLSNDEYAKKVINFANTNNLTKYSIIAHSQGGMVALHILNYYHTGLTRFENGREIQTLGTPWKGSELAGSIGSIASVFGLGCGSNSDLSVDGSINWLSKLNIYTYSSVYYYTTTYDTSSIFSEYCSLVTSPLLIGFDDGVTSLNSGQLTNQNVVANNMGNTEGQCHTIDMLYPASYADIDRAKTMYLNAANN